MCTFCVPASLPVCGTSTDGAERFEEAPVDVLWLAELADRAVEVSGVRVMFDAKVR